jgi:hypothetical protein
MWLWSVKEMIELVTGMPVPQFGDIELVSGIPVPQFGDNFLWMWGL